MAQADRSNTFGSDLVIMTQLIGCCCISGLSCGSTFKQPMIVLLAVCSGLSETQQLHQYRSAATRVISFILHVQQQYGLHAHSSMYVNSLSTCFAAEAEDIFCQDQNIHIAISITMPTYLYYPRVVMTKLK